MSVPKLTLYKRMRLRQQAKAHYLVYHKAMDELDCGTSLGEYISGTAQEAKRKFNETMDKLALIDPSCPKTRL